MNKSQKLDEHLLFPQQVRTVILLQGAKMNYRYGRGLFGTSIDAHFDRIMAKANHIQQAPLPRLDNERDKWWRSVDKNFRKDLVFKRTSSDFIILLTQTHFALALTH